MGRKRKISTEDGGGESKHAKRMRLKRQSSAMRIEEQERDTKRRKAKRQNQEIRQLEQERDTNQRNMKRQDQEIRQRDQTSNAKQMKRKRQDQEVRQREQEHDTSKRNKKRQDQDIRQREQEQNTNKRNRKRQNQEVRHRENANRQLGNASFEELVKQYNEEIEDGPTHICGSCGGLWFKRSLTAVTKERLEGFGCNQQLIKNLLQESNQLCSTCLAAARSRRLPRLNLSNGFRLPVIPDTLKSLTELEQRLVSPRLPFLQIRPVGILQSYRLKGNVVNIMNDLDICAKVLPRKMNDTKVVEVQLKRRMADKSSYMHENVRPQLVQDAARLLCSTELYRRHGIIFSEEWNLDHGLTPQHLCEDLERTTINEANTDHVNNEDSDEEEEPLNPGANESLILQEEHEILRIAPGEGKRPTPWLADLDAEQLSYPSMYGGVPRKYNEDLKITSSDIIKSETRMFDRRCCKPQKVLYSAKLLQNLKTAEAINICLRKKRGQSYKASDVTNEVNVDTLVNHDDGFRILKNIRSSPAFWEAQQKKVLALIRQTTLPTVFITFSAAETKWPELLTSLKKILHNEDISYEDALAMPFAEKAKLLREDTVTCARYYDHRFRSMFNLLINKKNGVFAPYDLKDHYFKTEFAHRNAAHNHGFAWLKNAPIYNREDPNSATECIEFIDQFITCNRFGDEQLQEVIQYQVHKHTHTCKQKSKDGGWTCRFNLPQPPMQSTTILSPLPKEHPDYEAAKKNFKSIHSTLVEYGKDFLEDIPFETFLLRLGLTAEEYLLAVRTSITREKVFLRRRTCEAFINAYNEPLLKAWKANMDIQFVLDAFSCVKYCTSYLTKSYGGLSKLMRDVQAELKAGNLSIKEKMRKIANKFINASEISAVEAAYLVLGQPLTSCSRDEIFINTSIPEERVRLVKAKKELEQLDPDSEDIYVKDQLSSYTQRPEELEDTCLADFSANYQFVRKTGNSNALPFLDGSGYVIRRTTPKIIRYRRYNREKDPMNYAREQLMLYLPWRTERTELLEVNHQEKLTSSYATIISNRTNFDPRHTNEEIEELAEQAENDFLDYQHRQQDDPDYDTDIYESMGKAKPAKKFDFIQSTNRASELEYKRNVCTLNEKQRRYFLHFVHLLKTNKPQTFDYIAGQAGVGKSHLISALVQFCLRWFSRDPGVNLQNPFQLTCAPTGKAAFNISGYTLHSSFRLPPNQYSGNIAPLQEDVCNSLRVKLSNLKIIIIDEISMVSLKMFTQIDARLKQLFQNQEPFGGLHVIVVGDFYQIRPVFGQFVFEVPRNEPFGQIVATHLWSNFKMYQLTEIMRQKNEADFAVALNHMGKGCMTEVDIALIKSRQVPENFMAPPGTMHMFRTNAECGAFNASVHERLNTTWCISEARDVVYGETSEFARLNILNQMKNLKTSDTDGLPASLRLQLEARYMISTNVDVADGLFNGSDGVLKHIVFGVNGEGLQIPTLIYVSFILPNIGASARAANQHFQRQHGINMSWTPIKLMTKEMNKLGYNDALRISRCQFPVVPSNAITFDKSQGSGSAHTAPHIRHGLRRDLVYVGCSRAFTPDGLYIYGEFEPPGPPPTYLTEEIERLEQNPLNLCLRFLQDTPSSYHRMVFHNVERLLPNFEHILADHTIMSSDVLGFVEPWLLPTDQVIFPAFNSTYRQDCNTNQRNSTGSILLAKNQLENYSFILEKSNTGHYSFTTWTAYNITVIMVYRSPTSHSKEFFNKLNAILEHLSSQPLLVVGDFNQDININCTILEFFSKHSLYSCLPSKTPSTDGLTQIDLCFSNVAVQAWYYESIYSYHKPICIIWPNDGKVSKLIEQKSPTNSSTSNNTEQMDTSAGFTVAENNAIAKHILNQLQSRKKSFAETDIQEIRQELQTYEEQLQQLEQFLKQSQVQLYDRQRQDKTSIQMIPVNINTQYAPCETTNDGNCFFRAVSLNLYGTEIYFHLIKLTVLDDIIKNRPAYEHLLNESQSEDSYNSLVYDTATYKKWTGPIATFATSKIISRPINIFSGNLNRLFMFTESDNTKTPICIHYRSDTPTTPPNHFVALLRHHNLTLHHTTYEEYEELREFGGLVDYV